MTTAEFVREIRVGASGAVWHLYKLSEPYDVRDWDGNVEQIVEHVVVSAATVMITGPETYVFPADAEGKVVDWGELEGSYRGGLDHAAALGGFLASTA